MSSPVLDIASVGDNCVDLIHGRDTRSLIGGNALNVAVQTAGQGLRAGYFGAVGPVGDPAAGLVRSALAVAGVDAAGLVHRTAPTSVTRIRLDATGERTIEAEDFGACAGYRPDADALHRLMQARHVHIGWLDDGGDLRHRLCSAGVSVSQDISVNAAPRNLAVDGLQIAFAALPETRAAEADPLARRLLAEGARHAIVTLGAAGSFALIDGQSHRGRALPCQVVDSTGAGDSFIAGVLCARLTGADWDAALARGHAKAARTCVHPGGFPQ